MTLFDTLTASLESSHCSYQSGLDAIHHQHRKPQVNRWIPQRLLDEVPLMPVPVAVVRIVDGVVYPHNPVAVYLSAIARTAHLSEETIWHAKKLGIRFEVEQRRVMV